MSQYKDYGFLNEDATHMHKDIYVPITNHWDTHQNPLWDGGHIKMWSKNTLTKLLEEFDFEVIAFEGCCRIPYLWKSMMIIAKI